jgi:branched-chain amino acid transport system permease protein
VAKSLRGIGAGRWVLLLCLVALLATPATGEVFYIRLVTRMFVFSIFAMSLNLLVGYTGLVSFGHAAFVGLGAYSVAALGLYGLKSALVVWPAAMVVAAAGALVIGALALRTSGVYFIMITLAFAQMLYYVAVGLARFGGDDGMRMAARNAFPGLNLDKPVPFFYVVAAIFLALLFASARIVRSRFGRVLRGIKDNERRMQSLGFNTYRYKLVAFVIAGALAGLGGALDANLNAFVSPRLFHWELSGDLLIMVILGGLGSVAGAPLGAAAFIVLEEILSSITKHWMAIFGPLMLLVILLHKGGIHALVVRKHDR